MNTPEEIVELCYEWSRIDPDDLLEARARLGAIHDACQEYIEEGCGDIEYSIDA